jgi:hypothetical protein
MCSFAHQDKETRVEATVWRAPKALFSDFSRCVERHQPRECFLDICPGQARRIDVSLADVAVEIHCLLSRPLLLDRELRMFSPHGIPSYV